MKKAAFTMVELIFVIVILGILAAVAVPRLNASREDAEITKFAANLATIYKDVQTYYLANGTVITDEAKISDSIADITKITSVPLEDFGWGGYQSLQIGGKACLPITLTKKAEGEFMAIRREKSLDNSNPMCKKMWEVFASKPELNELITGQAGIDFTVERISSLATHDLSGAAVSTWRYKPIIFYKDGVDFD